MNYETKRQQTQYTSEDYAIAHRVVGHTLLNGGGTFTRNGCPVTPESGYAVALEGQRYAEFPQVGPALELLSRVSYSAEYFGTWYDSGRLYVEPCEIIADRESAVRIGRERGQLAIYDFAAGEVITLA